MDVRTKRERRRSTKDKKMKWVSIEGMMSSGKSTLSVLLCDKLGYNLVPEPVKEWEESGILEASYTNPQMYSFPAQTVFFTSRIAAFRKVVTSLASRESADPPVIVSDASPFSDKGYWNTKLAREDVNPMLHSAYLNMWNEWQNLLPIRKPSLFLYLSISVEECMKRLRLRNREAETTVDVSYLQTLKEQQDKIFLDPLGVLMPDGTRVKCIVIDAMPNFRDNEGELLKILEQLQL